MKGQSSIAMVSLYPIHSDCHLQTLMLSLFVGVTDDVQQEVNFFFDQCPTSQFQGHFQGLRDTHSISGTGTVGMHAGVVYNIIQYRSKYTVKWHLVCINIEFVYYILRQKSVLVYNYN